MGRGSREAASGASGLLYGPRRGVRNGGREDDFDQALADGDFTYANQLLTTLPADSEREIRLRNSLAASVQHEYCYRQGNVLDVFAIRDYYSDCIVVEHKRNSRILHLSHDTENNPLPLFGAKNGPAVTAVCGRSLSVDSQDETSKRPGDTVFDGSRALRGSWAEPPPHDLNCSDCAQQAEDFPELFEDPDEALPGLIAKTAAEIDLGAADIKEEAERAGREAFLALASEAATEASVVERLYSHPRHRLLGSDLAERFKAVDMRPYLERALDRGDSYPAITVELERMLIDHKLPLRFESDRDMN